MALSDAMRADRITRLHKQCLDLADDVEYSTDFHFACRATEDSIIEVLECRTPQIPKHVPKEVRKKAKRWRDNYHPRETVEQCIVQLYWEERTEESCKLWRAIRDAIRLPSGRYDWSGCYQGCAGSVTIGGIVWLSAFSNEDYDRSEFREVAKEAVHAFGLSPENWLETLYSVLSYEQRHLPRNIYLSSAEAIETLEERRVAGSPDDARRSEANRKIVQVLREAGHRMTTKEILSALRDKHGDASEGTTKQHLAMLVQHKVLNNRQDVTPNGYGLPEWK